MLLEYLLDRRIKKIDYLIISHFDSDHCENSKEIIKNLKVKNLIIGKQVEENEEFNQIVTLARNKKVNIVKVQNGDTIRIDKETSVEILWPDNSAIVQKNAINNNAIVAKFQYEKFSVLFTGDIEKEAEEKILQKYSSKLQATILKVGHHGANTSTTDEFIKMVQPKIGLIGVGKDNKYGHPNSQIIEKLKKNEVKIYRTDLCGEISIILKRNEKMKIDTHLK